MRPSPGLIRTTAVVAVSLLLSWGLFLAARSIEATCTPFGRWLFNHPADQPFPDHGDPDFFLQGMATLLWRFTHLYIPIIAFGMALLVGLVAKNWHWAWLPAILAEALVVVMAAVVVSRIDLGVLYSFSIATASAVFATFLVWNRERATSKRVDS